MKMKKLALWLLMLLTTAIYLVGFGSCAFFENITSDTSSNEKQDSTDNGISVSIKVPEGATVTGTVLQAVSTDYEGVFSIPDGITQIAECAFENCTEITGIIISETVKEIGRRAFYNCKALVSIEIPQNVETIDDFAFYNCEKLEDIFFFSNSNLEYLGNKLFNNCSNLFEITLPEGITSISATFSDCVNLKKVVIPKSVTDIGNSAFSGCSSLEDMILPEGVMTIGIEAFLGCSNMKSIVIPSSITTINKKAFYDCDNLEKVYYGGMKTNWDNIYIDPPFNTRLTNATRYYYSKNQPTVDGNYWHYSNDNPSIW